jgi:hypothetical protein
MDETLFQHFWVIGVFLGRKTNKTLFEEENQNMSQPRKYEGHT